MLVINSAKPIALNADATSLQHSSTTSTKIEKMQHVQVFKAFLITMSN